MGRRARQRRKAAGLPPTESDNERYRRVLKERNAYWDSVEADVFQPIRERTSAAHTLQARVRRSIFGR